MTATNMCYNFVGFRYSPPHKQLTGGEKAHQFLLHQLSVTVQRGDALVVMASVGGSSSRDNPFIIIIIIYYYYTVIIAS